MRVRETPRLGYSIMAKTPSGKLFRWAADELRPENRPTGVTHGSGMPGGYQTLGASLPRKPNVDYSDLDELTELEVLDAAGDTVWSGYLERAASVSGDRLEVTPDAVGWQAYLEDVQGINWLGVDPRTSEWGEAPPWRRLDLEEWGPIIGPSSADLDGFMLEIDEMHQASSVGTIAEAHYTAVGIIGYVEVQFTGVLAGAWRAELRTTALDSSSGQNQTVVTGTTSPQTISRTGNGSNRRAYLLWRYNAAHDGRGPWKATARPLVVGTHGLPLHSAIGGGQGLLASDVIRYALTRWAPLLKHDDDSIMRSDFVIPVSVEEDTTVRGIIESVDKYQLWDWACWGKRFYYQPQGANAKRWKARVGPSNLQEAGKDARRVLNAVRVRFTDVDGTQRTVGPPGGGDQVESEQLIDRDPLNKATLAGRKRWHVLRLRSTSTTAAAIEAGRRYMQMMQQADRSGTATITGYIANHVGILYPHTSVRAGDVIEFVDARDRSARRISDVQHSHDTRESIVTLDAPPEGWEAILERLDAVLEGVL